MPSRRRTTSNRLETSKRGVLPHDNWDNWDDLRIVLAIERSGSLKAAAATLGVNVSTVARRLDRLEAALSLHLFDRTADGTVVTAAGDELLPFAEAMEHAALGVANALAGFEAEPEGRVRITAPPGVAEHFVAADVGMLLERHPRLSVELISTIGYADLTRREADVAIRAKRPTSGDLLAVRLGSSASCILASCDHAAPVSKLDDLRWITYREDLGHLPDASWITSQVSPENIVLRTNSLTAQLNAVSSGLGVTVASDAFAERDPRLAVGRLTPALARRVAPFPESFLWLVGHRALRDVPRVAAVWNFVQERFEAAGLR